jgi:uncharacterized protein YcbK (DUF882 family)
MGDLSKNFNLSELTYSATAERHKIDNKPGEEETNNLKQLAAYILQKIRDEVDVPLIITSGYRSPELNKFLGGSKTSLHTSGNAADIHTNYHTIQELYDIVKQMAEEGKFKPFFIELIFEGRTLHIGVQNKHFQNEFIPNGEKYLSKK